MGNPSGILTVSTDGVCEIYYETQACKWWYPWLWRTYNEQTEESWTNISESNLESSLSAKITSPLSERMKHTWA